MEDIEAHASFCYPLPDGTIAVDFRINNVDAGTIVGPPEVLQRLFDRAIRSISIIEIKISAESR